MKLYFDRHYQKSNLMNIAEFTQESLTKIEEIEKQNNKITSSNLQLDPRRDVSDQYFLMHYFLDNDTLYFNQNFTCEQMNNKSSQIQIESNYLRKIEQIRTLKIYIKIGEDEFDHIWFLLHTVIGQRCRNLTKLAVYQLEFSNPPEKLYCLLAYFINKYPNIQIVKMRAISKNFEEFEEGENNEKEENEVSNEKKKNRVDFDEKSDENSLNESRRNKKKYENDEENTMITRRLAEEFKTVNPILNKRYLFCYFQALSMRKNLIELDVNLFIKEYGFLLLADVVYQNPKLRKLSVRCMNSGLVSVDNKELNQLEYTFATYNGLGEKTKDEIFIFFNYLMTLEDLEVFKLTHFWFNSDLNFMSCELAKENPKLTELSLAYNQAVINNDEALLDSFSFNSTKLQKLDMGISYFHMIRRFDYLIGPELLELNCGVLDFVSVICLMKYVKETRLRKLKCILNKPCHLDSIDLIFKQIADHIIASKTLRKFEINNLYYIKNNKDEESIEKIRIGLSKDVLKKLMTNKVMRSLILNEKLKHSRYMPLTYFKYYPEKNHGNCCGMIHILNQLYASKTFTRGISMADMVENICFFANGKYRKILI